MFSRRRLTTKDMPESSPLKFRILVLVLLLLLLSLLIQKSVCYYYTIITTNSYYNHYLLLLLLITRLAVCLHVPVDIVLGFVRHCAIVISNGSSITCNILASRFLGRSSSFHGCDSSWSICRLPHTSGFIVLTCRNRFHGLSCSLSTPGVSVRG